MTWRVFWFLIKLGIVGALAVFFASEPGLVSIDWRGWAIDMPVGIFVVVILVLLALLVYAERIRQTLFRFPSRWRAHRAAIREAKGYRALTQGMVAVAAGDREEARKQSKRARALLSNAPLTRLLEAQTARLNGDDRAAVAYFEEMRRDPDVAFLGLRGLMTQALRDGEQDRALELAEQARGLRPNAQWVLRELLTLQIEAGQWARALETLSAAERTGALDTAEIAQTRTRLTLHQAHRLAEAGERKDALKAAQAVLKSDSGDAAAAILAADLLKRDGKTRKAEGVIETAWKAAPRPDLAAAYRDLAPQGVSALTQVKRFEHLLSLAPEAAESHIALAEASLEAELWGEARSHLAKATEMAGDAPSARVCRLWARLEEAEHGDLTAAHRWLLRAAEGEPSDGAATLPPPTPPARRTEETLPV